MTDPVDGIQLLRGCPDGSHLVRSSDGAVLMIASKRGLRAEVLAKLGLPPPSRVPAAVHAPPLHTLGTLVLEPATKGRPGRRKTNPPRWLPLDDEYLRARYPLDGAASRAVALASTAYVRHEGGWIGADECRVAIEAAHYEVANAEDAARLEAA